MKDVPVTVGGRFVIAPSETNGTVITPLGIATVHQQFTLIPELTVAENLFLGRLPRTRLGVVDWDRLYRDAAEVLSRLDFSLDVKQPVRALGAAARQVTEIARALSLDARILILDEPTAVVGPSEV